MKSFFLSIVVFASLAIAVDVGSTTMPTKAPPTPPLCVWDRNASPLRTVEPRSSDNDECSIDADITSPCSAVSWRNLTAVRGGCAVSIRAPAQCFALQIQADYPVSLQYDASGTILIVFNVSGGISPLGSQSSAIFVDGSDAVLTAGFVVGHGFPTAFKSLFSLSAVPCSLLPAGIPTQPPRTNPVPTTTTTTTVPTDSITTLIPPTCTPVSIVLPPSPMTVTTCRVALPGNSAMPCFTGVWNSPVEFGNTCEISYQSLESGSGTQCLRIDLFARFDSATPGLFADRFGELTAVVAENAPMSHRTLDLVGTATTFNLYARSAPTDASVPFNVAFTVFNCSNVPATTTWAAPDTDTTVATEPDYDTTTAPTSTEWVIGDTTLTAMSNWWLTHEHALVDRHAVSFDTSHAQDAAAHRPPRLAQRGPHRRQRPRA
jgi:hypothetical protein